VCMYERERERDGALHYFLQRDESLRIAESMKNFQIRLDIMTKLFLEAKRTHIEGNTENLSSASVSRAN
jgi:hypothetical protein